VALAIHLQGNDGRDENRQERNGHSDVNSPGSVSTGALAEADVT
jgi:hypothetical protein